MKMKMEKKKKKNRREEGRVRKHVLPLSLKPSPARVSIPTSFFTQ